MFRLSPELGRKTDVIHVSPAVPEHHRRNQTAILFSSPHPVCKTDPGKYFVILIAFICIALLVAGCITTTTIGNPAPAPAATAEATAAASAPVGTAAPVAAATTPSCPDKEVLTGSWDSHEVGYASNHDVREAGTWEDAGPVPVTLTQRCWDVTGRYSIGDCPGTLTGKIEKNVVSGKFDIACTNSADSKSGRFPVTMAAYNLSFMGEMYDPANFGPEAGFPPGWWKKKAI